MLSIPGSVVFAGPGQISRHQAMITITFVGDVVTNEVVSLCGTNVQVSSAAVEWGIWAVYQYTVCRVFRPTQQIT